jgi:transcriptional regulator with XRE-family HTH domain
MDSRKTSSRRSSIGARVRVLRLELGLSQAQLAAMMPGVKQQSIDQLEQDKVKRPHYAPELAVALNTTVDFLLRGKKDAAKKLNDAPFDRQLLLDVVNAVEREAETHRATLTHSEKAKIISTLYDMFMHEVRPAGHARLADVTRGIIQFARYGRKGR